MGRWTRLGFLAAGAALLALLAIRVDWIAVAEVISTARTAALLMAAAFVAANVAVKGLRWRLLVRRLTASGPPLSFAQAVQAVLAGVTLAAGVRSGEADAAPPVARDAAGRGRRGGDGGTAL